MTDRAPPDVDEDEDEPSMHQKLHAATGDREAEARALAGRSDDEVTEEDAELACDVLTVTSVKTRRPRIMTSPRRQTQKPPTRSMSASESSSFRRSEEIDHGNDEAERSCPAEPEEGAQGSTGVEAQHAGRVV